jgi:hypothetical protein
MMKTMPKTAKKLDGHDFDEKITKKRKLDVLYQYIQKGIIACFYDVIWHSCWDGCNPLEVLPQAF